MNESKLKACFVPGCGGEGGELMACGEVDAIICSHNTNHSTNTPEEWNSIPREEGDWLCQAHAAMNETCPGCEAERADSYEGDVQRYRELQEVCRKMLTTPPFSTLFAFLDGLAEERQDL